MGRNHGPKTGASRLGYDYFGQSSITLGGGAIGLGLTGQRFRNLGKVVRGGAVPRDEIFALPTEGFHGWIDPSGVNIVSHRFLELGGL